MKLLTREIKRALISGAGGGKAGRTPVEAPDSLRSIAYAHILDIVSEGEIEGFANPDNPLTCVYLNETPVANADESLNFQNIQVDFRPGSQTQDYIKGFDSTVNEIGVGVELRDDVPWTRSITNLNLTSVRVRIAVLALSKTNTSNGDITGHKISYKIELATDGGSYNEVFASSFSGKTTTKYERSHEIALPAATTGWLIRVTRTTPNADSATIADTTSIESFAEVIDAKLRMPMTAAVAIIVDAEQFNSIPSRAYHLKGRIIRVPSNYDPETRAYTGTWDGTFQLRYSNNPAWVFYDMATNRRYGLGRRVSDAMVDKWALYQIAQYCDELVSDGKGGMEPRFTCNIFFQRQEDASRVMMHLATVFRGIMYASGSSITAVADMPQDPVYTYTRANVIDGKFTYSGSARSVRHTVALVSWNDMSDFGRAKLAYYQDDVGVARYGVLPTETIAMGCTSEAQALRMAKYIVTTERLETNSVAFSVGLDGTIVAPGKIIKIADPLKANTRRGGRIVSATTSTVVVDLLPGDASVGNFVTMVKPDATLTRHEVTAIDFLNKQLTFTPALDAGDVPIPESVWLLESAEVNAQTYRVISVAPQSDNPLVFDIAAIQHEPGKFDFVEEGVSIETTPISTGINKLIGSPTDITMTWRNVADDFTTQQIITVEWAPVFGAMNYILKYRQNDGSWNDLGSTPGTSLDFISPVPGAFFVSIVAQGAGNILSAPSFAGPFDVLANSEAPGFVSVLEGQIDSALDAAINAQATADGKITSFWQSAPPAIGSGSGEAQEGDIWFDTDDGNRVWRVVSGVWTDAQDDDLAAALSAASNAQATADGKVQTFFQSTQPTATAVGDLWYNTLSKILRRWNGSTWAVWSAADAPTNGDASVLNYDFEIDQSTTDCVGWSSVSCTPSFVTSGDQYSGTYSARLLNSAANGGFWSRKVYACKPGDSYRLTCAVRAVVGTARASLRFYDASGSFLANGSLPDYAINAWGVISEVIVVPSGAYSFVITITGVESNADTRWDQIQIDKIAQTINAPNFLVNAGFHNGTSGWSGLASISANTVEANLGVTGAVGSGSSTYVYQDVAFSNLPAGSDICFQTELFMVGPSSNAKASVYIEFYNGASLAGSIAAPFEIPHTQQRAGVFYNAHVAGKVPNVTHTKIRPVIKFDGPMSYAVIRYPKLARASVPTPWDIGADVTIGPGLTVPGSNRRLGDQRNLMQSLVTAYGAVRTATALSATSAGAVTVNAHTVRYGATSVSYNAVSNAVTGLTQNQTYTIYCFDDNYTGGTKTWYANTDATAVMNLGDGVVVAGRVTIPTSGSNTGGGDGTCVDADMLLPDGRRAGDIEKWDMIPCWNEDPEEPGVRHLVVESNQIVPDQRCREIRTEMGASVTASESTPFTLKDGSIEFLPNMLGKEVLVRYSDGRMEWQRVVNVSDIMLRPIAKIRVNQKCYFAGTVAGATIATHNPVIKP